MTLRRIWNCPDCDFSLRTDGRNRLFRPRMFWHRISRGHARGQDL